MDNKTQTPFFDNPFPLLISLVGFSGTGKTTLIANLIPIFKNLGIKAGTIKHAGHGFEIDSPGKDTYIHKHAGAFGIMIVSKNKMAVVKDIDEDEGPETMAVKYLPEADIILVEGYKKEKIPKMEMLGFEKKNTPFFLDDPDLIGIIGKYKPEDCPVPFFDIDDADCIADFIINTYKITRD